MSIQKFTHREYRAVILLMMLVILVLFAVIFVGHIQPSNPAGQTQPLQPGNTLHSGKPQYPNNPKRDAYIHERDSYYVAAEEYYRNQKNYYRKRIAQFKDKPDRSTTNAKHAEQPQPERGSGMHSSKFTSPQTVDPNTADSLTLCSIPGIGKVISANIIRYREQLGGFVKVEQLLECKFFTEDLLPWFRIGDNSLVRKLQINKASYAQLISHPYIGKKETQDILNHRRMYGQIADEEALITSGIFSDDILNRLLPYIEY